MGVPSSLNKFLLNPRIRTFPGTVPGSFLSTDVKNQEPSGHRSHNDPHPEVEFSACRASNLSVSEPDETYHMLAGVQGGFPFCSRGTSSGKQKKVRSTSQSQFRNENTPARIEADQIFSAIQQLEVTVTLLI